MNELQERRRTAFWPAFWSAFAAPGLLFAADPPRITRVETKPKTSARDALRNDWTRIGKDFGNVIASEEAASKP